MIDHNNTPGLYGSGVIFFDRRSVGFPIWILTFYPVTLLSI